MTFPPTPPRVRLTISVSADVHATYRRLAQASGRSIGMEMGEWLAETLAAAEHMTGLLEQVRTAPKRAVEDIQNFTETLGQLESIRRSAGDWKDGPTRLAKPARAGSRPPPSNTGGKPPKQHNRARSK